MSQKNSLTNIKLSNKNTLSNLMHKPSPVKTNSRTAKPAAEKQSELVGLRFTPSELAVVKQKAGLVPVATFIKNELIEKTALLD
ncbi:hypothetical protein N473_10560 [Pseudoalteromonas luteoviolacea CPMOR-1]|uniref:Uncharacterized protein n=1 Tax=Pseudoalteromonas luteoviolacea CPMOR-1 TaxID=1365248 RepID=A0A167M9M2_9GAMM|nr:hypothetical protein [Pseudoalteromonas luteoviolacea]KZN66002.1 hypothetical protein N473_10560 [Pseudoalteromonas luteoviolacea CPMOR-1]